MRFVKEYANYEKDKIVKADLRNEVKANALKAIDKAVHMYDRGMLTGTDTIREIGYVVIHLE